MENSISYLSFLRAGTSSVYWVILVALSLSISIMPFVYLDISVRSDGIIRPKYEKTELRAGSSGLIDSIYFKEGDTLQKGDIIIRLRKENLAIRRSMNQFEIDQRNSFISDLSALTLHTEFNRGVTPRVWSPLYKQELSRFTFQLAELNAQLKKLSRELQIDSLLLADRVIAPKEMFDKQIEHERLRSTINATTDQQIAIWQQALAKYKLERSQFENMNRQLNEDVNQLLVRAAIGGVLQGFNKYQQGSFVQQGDVLGSISPEASLTVECFINTNDVGLLKINQSTVFQVDAFDHNYFGVLKGRIISIDNDYTLVANRPAYKVCCTLEAGQLYLKNGFKGVLKKGMTVRARYIVARRSLWQLAFDQIDDWVNPTEGKKGI